MNKIVTLFAALVMIILAGNTALAANINDSRLQNMDTIKVRKVKINKVTKHYSINVAYPVTGYRSIDSNIKRRVEKIINESKNEFKVNIGKSDLTIDYNITHYKKDYISIRLDVYTFTGGAHGNSYAEFMTYNTMSGKLITYSNIFRPGYAYLKVLSNITRHKLKIALKERSFDYDETSQEGTAPKLENYKNYYINEKGIVVYFAPYQVACYAAGDFEITIEWEKLADGLNGDFAI